MRCDIGTRAIRYSAPARRAFRDIRSPPLQIRVCEAFRVKQNSRLAASAFPRFASDGGAGLDWDFLDASTATSIIGCSANPFCACLAVVVRIAGL